MSRYYYRKILSITIAVALLSIISVSALPFFAKNGHNEPLIFTGVLSNFLCALFLANELKLWKKCRAVIGRFKTWVIPLWNTEIEVERLCQGETGENDDEAVQLGVSIDEPKIKKHNLLAYFFFIGYFWTQGWRIVNVMHFLVNSDSCASFMGFGYDTSKLLLSALLMGAMASDSKEFSSNSKSTLSYIGWCCTGAVSFSSAFKYVIQDVIYAYLEFWENSPAPPSSISDMMNEILKTVEICTSRAVIPPNPSFIITHSQFFNFKR